MSPLKDPTGTWGHVPILAETAASTPWPSQPGFHSHCWPWRAAAGTDCFCHTKRTGSQWGQVSPMLGMCAQLGWAPLLGAGCPCVSMCNSDFTARVQGVEMLASPFLLQMNQPARCSVWSSRFLWLTGTARRGGTAKESSRVGICQADGKRYHRGGFAYGCLEAQNDGQLPTQEVRSRRKPRVTIQWSLCPPENGAMGQLRPLPQLGVHLQPCVLWLLCHLGVTAA